MKSVAHHRKRSLEPGGFTVPGVADLLLDASPAFLDTPMPEVLARFQARSDLLAMPVLDGEKYVGTLSRGSFLSYMTQGYVREVFSRRPLGELLRATPSLAQTPIVAQDSQRVDQVMRDYLLSDTAFRSEAVPVMSGERFVGLAGVSDMMLSLARSQSQLISTLDKLASQLKDEVAHAAVLQQTLLPPSALELPGVRGVARLITSSEVGGDYYDYYAVENRWVVLLVGDVSGHGVAAGTMVSAAKAGVYLLADGRERDPGLILARLNKILLGTARQSLLMTMFCAVLDTQSGEMGYANAGHPFPYLYRLLSDEWTMLEAGGLPLGKDAHVEYPVETVELDVGDRLLFYTDGLVEEENAAGEAFGYDRLEALLKRRGGEDKEILRDALIEEVRAFCGRSAFGDDVTVLCVEHTERMRQAIKGHARKSAEQDYGIVRIAESFYRANTDPMSHRIARQIMVLLAEGNFSDLIPRMAAEGIRRALPRHVPIVQRLNWERLLMQHQRENVPDLLRLLPRPRLHREFVLQHSDDKTLVMEDVESWLLETVGVAPDRVAPVMLVLDEVIENGLYAAPRNSRGQPIHTKGEVRALPENERLHLALAIEGNVLGVSLLDDWGTLTPSVFLMRLSLHTQGKGMDAGIGGTGLYLMWRMSDYLQIRVIPRHKTEVSAFFDLATPFDEERDAGFQFFFHHEIHEVVSHEPIPAPHRAPAIG